MCEAATSSASPPPSARDQLPSPLSIRCFTSKGCLCQDVPSAQGHRSLAEECMRNQFEKTAAACALAILGLSSATSGQAPAPAAQAAPTAPVSSAVAAPTYISIPLEIDVNRPAAAVWKRVGKFCDIGE